MIENLGRFGLRALTEEEQQQVIGGGFWDELVQRAVSALLDFLTEPRGPTPTL